jgi:hypothetical protein
MIALYEHDIQLSCSDYIITTDTGGSAARYIVESLIKQGVNDATDIFKFFSSR